ncbi:hypothetical protein XPA_006035 [Xanthoria parietina]
MHRDTQTALDPQSLGTELFRSPQLQRAQCICLCAPSREISGSSTVLLEVIGPHAAPMATLAAVRDVLPVQRSGQPVLTQAQHLGNNISNSDPAMRDIIPRGINSGGIFFSVRRR